MNAKKMIAITVLVAGVAFLFSTWTPAASRPQELEQGQANGLSGSPALSQPAGHRSWNRGRLMDYPAVLRFPKLISKEG
ncbi:MAG: hypothetical protein P8074_23110 [Anaerolineales bacterium]